MPRTNPPKTADVKIPARQYALACHSPRPADALALYAALQTYLKLNNPEVIDAEVVCEYVCEDLQWSESRFHRAYRNVMALSENPLLPPPSLEGFPLDSFPKTHLPPALSDASARKGKLNIKTPPAGIGSGNFPIKFHNHEPFQRCWAEFVEYRKLLKRPITAPAMRSLVRKIQRLSKNDVHVAVLILEQTMDNGWTGVFELHDGDQRREPRQDSAPKYNGISTTYQID